MSINCIIVEDQPPAQRILKKYIKDVGTLKLLDVFPDAIQALDFLKSNKVDLMFLDVHLPIISGMEFLKSMHHPPHVILTTAFPDYALESYEFDVVDYLLKPFSFQRFVKAISKVTTESTQTSDKADIERKELFIKSGHEHIKVNIRDIIYIKSDADYTELFIPNKKILTSEPLRHWLERLDADRFVRIHKSFIINTDKIEKMSGGQIYLEGNNIVPIGRAYKDDFVNRFLK